LQAELQEHFDALMGHAAKASALIPREVKGELGYALQIEEFRGLLNAAAVKIARDVASVSPLPDPTKPSRVKEFEEWRTGEVRPITWYVERNIAGIKAKSFPEFEPVAVPAPAAADREPAVATDRAKEPAATAAPVPFRIPGPAIAEGEVIDMRHHVVMIGEEESATEEELAELELVDETPAPEPVMPEPPALTAEREAELLATASI
jgi:hypothetical protein